MTKVQVSVIVEAMPSTFNPRTVRRSARATVRRLASELHTRSGVDLRQIRRSGRPSASTSGDTKAAQISLMLRYRDALDMGRTIDLVDTEARWHSQNGEDGILLYLLAATGMETRRCVEIGSGDGCVNNTANLVLHHGYDGLLIDGDERQTAHARAFYSFHESTSIWPPAIRHHWVTPENINDLLVQAGFVGEVDVLSIDLDSIDFWIWEAIEAVSPRVVVLEYNNVWGPGESFTLPKTPNFRMVHDADDPAAFYGGASLEALTRLSRDKGYRLVGSEHLCWNAFFVRNDLAVDALPEVSVGSCLKHPYALHVQSRRSAIRELDWVAVDRDTVADAEFAD